MSRKPPRSGSAKPAGPEAKTSSKTSGRTLDADDRALWSIAADRTEPLKRRKGRVRDAADSDVTTAAGSANDATTASRAVKSERTVAHAPGAESAVPTPATARSAPSKRLPPTPVTIVRAAPPVANFDRKAQKRLRAGRVEIEARIDLHGMRQDEAHAALRTFLFRSQGRGLRWVLVITGKGKAEDSSKELDVYLGDSRLRGVLRRNVPRWLEEPDLRPLVISYTAASPNHGGEGALYVHLRKHR